VNRRTERAPDGTRVRTFLEGAFGGVAAPALTAGEVARYARDLIEWLGAPPSVLEKRLSERTVRYYQSEGIVTPPDGWTTAARYGVRQVLETAVARLAGHVRMLSLEEAAQEVRRRDDDALAAFLVELADAAVAETDLALLAPRPLPGARGPAFEAAPPDRPSFAAGSPAGAAPASVPAVGGWQASAGAPAAATAIPLGDGALLVLPAAHPALVRATPAEVQARMRAALEGTG
jgi:DNA-binding transcriptional MerR regulator